MLTLDLTAEPYWLDLPRGVRVEIRPVTTAVMAAAQERMFRGIPEEERRAFVATLQTVLGNIRKHEDVQEVVRKAKERGPKNKGRGKAKGKNKD